MNDMQQFIDQYKRGAISKNTIIKMALLKGDIEKRAVVKTGPGSLLALMGLSAVAGGLASFGARGLEKLDDKIFDKRRKSEAMEKMLIKFPELKSDYDINLVTDYFDSLWHFSPHIAKDPMAARAYIKHALALHEVGGPTHMTYKDLIAAQEKSEKFKGNYPIRSAMAIPLAQLTQYSGGLEYSAQDQHLAL